MAKYVDTDTIVEKLWTVDPENDGSDGCTVVLQNLTFTSADLESLLDEIPAADVVPVVHGAPVRKIRPSKHEWYEEVKTENGEILYRKHVYVDETNWSEYCPACGKRLCSRFKSYCPSCGAIMDLEG